MGIVFEEHFRVLLRRFSSRERGGEHGISPRVFNLRQGSLRKKIEEIEDNFMFSCSSLVVFRHLMF